MTGAAFLANARPLEDSSQGPLESFHKRSILEGGRQVYDGLSKPGGYTDTVEDYYSWSTYDYMVGVDSWSMIEARKWTYTAVAMLSQLNHLQSRRRDINGGQGLGRLLSLKNLPRSLSDKISRARMALMLTPGTVASRAHTENG